MNCFGCMDGLSIGWHFVSTKWALNVVNLRNQVMLSSCCCWMYVVSPSISKKTLKVSLNSDIIIDSLKSLPVSKFIDSSKKRKKSLSSIIITTIKASNPSNRLEEIRDYNLGGILFPSSGAEMEFILFFLLQHPRNFLFFLCILKFHKWKEFFFV
jgi:hypothetical protein